MFDFGISIGIGIEILTFPGISIGIGIDQTQDKSQYRNWYRKSWYRRLLLPIPGYLIPGYLLDTQYPGIMHGYPGIRKYPWFGGFGDDFLRKSEKKNDFS